MAQIVRKRNEVRAVRVRVRAVRVRVRVISIGIRDTEEGKAR